MQHESWALDLPHTGQELVSAGVTVEVLAQSLIDFLVHRPRAFDHDINVQRRGSWVAKLRRQPYAGKFGIESWLPVFATLITQPAKLDEACS
jgi:hypothetical protein